MLAGFGNQLGTCEQTKHMALGRLNARTGNQWAREASKRHQERKPAGEGSGHSDEMHSPFVFWTFRDLNKTDFESFKIFHIFGLYGKRVKQMGRNGRPQFVRHCLVETKGWVFLQLALPLDLTL